MKRRAFRRLGRHVGSNAIAYAALFFALTGSAVAAKPLLTGADIQDNTITSADVKDGDVQAVDVKANSLTGAVIDESTLTLPAWQRVTSLADHSSRAERPDARYAAGRGRLDDHAEL